MIALHFDTEQSEVAEDGAAHHSRGKARPHPGKPGRKQQYRCDELRNAGADALPRLNAGSCKNRRLCQPPVISPGG